MPSVYADGEFTAEDNVYAYLFYDIKIKIPKGWRYDTYKIHTKATDCANHLGLPEDTKTAESSDRTVTGKYHINIVVSGLKTLEKIRYTGSEYDIILKANECNVIYDSNGGSGNMSDQTVTYETASKLKANSFVRQGYRFTGWNTKKDGSGKDYEDRETVTKAFPVKEKVTLYAQWKEIKPTGITLSRTKVIGEKGKTASLAATVIPDNANNKSVTFSSSDLSVVSVSGSGVLSFNKAGNAVVTVKTTNGLTAKSRVCVYTVIKDDDESDIKGYTKEKTDLLDYGYAKSSVMRSAAKNEKLSIQGECGSFYYVKMDKDSKTGFIKKSDIVIPVVKILVNSAGDSLKKGHKRKMTKKLIPYITTQKNGVWKSSNKNVAAVSKFGIVNPLKAGRVTILYTINKKVGQKNFSIKAPEQVGFINHRNIPEDKKDDTKMQGLTGIGKTIFFIRIKKEDGKDKYARLYKCKITKKNGEYKVLKEWKFFEYKKLGHANGMTAVKEKNGKTALYIAPCAELSKTKKRLIYRVRVDNKNNKLLPGRDKLYLKDGKMASNKLFKTSTITKINSIASWKNNNKQYLILNCERKKKKNINYVFELKSNALHCHYSFSTGDSYDQNGNKTTQQGATFVGSDMNYYLVASHAYNYTGLTDKVFEKIWNNSYVFRYELSIRNNKMKAKSIASYRLTAKKQVSWNKKWKNKKSGRYKPRFEMEDLYIYKERIYFNSEGGKKCLDFVGSF